MEKSLVLDDVHLKNEHVLLPGEILPECSVINSQRINDQCMGQVIGTWVVILNKFGI